MSFVRPQAPRIRSRSVEKPSMRCIAVLAFSLSLSVSLSAVPASSYANLDNQRLEVFGSSYLHW